jgi:hypothetical protein
VTGRHAEIVNRFNSGFVWLLPYRTSLGNPKALANARASAWRAPTKLKPDR